MILANIYYLPQSAMFLIRKYTDDKESGNALLAWLRPFENSTYRKQRNLKDLIRQNSLTKSMLPKSGRFIILIASFSEKRRRN